MQAKKIALATLLSAAFVGSAFAAQPAAGEGPLFQDEAVAQSTATRAEVIQQAIATPPAAGVSSELTASKTTTPSKFTRAEVRKQTRDAIAGGYKIRSGEAG